LPVTEGEGKDDEFGHRVPREELGPTMETEGDCTLRSLVVCTAHKYWPGYQIKKDERGRTCSTYGADGKYRQVMVEKTRRKRPTRTVEQDGRLWNGLL
jgi:hypothetical protein